ncbi:UNVERIFIED_ORG: hypothetical protein ABIB19_003797 [Arthrobacter sp. UYEF10]
MACSAGGQRFRCAMCRSRLILRSCPRSGGPPAGRFPAGG